MDTHTIVAAMQAEISRLTQAVSILTGGAGVKRRGRPPGSKNTVTTSTNGTAPRRGRPSSSWTPEKRRQAAKRMKAFWAAKKKTSKKS